MMRTGRLKAVTDFVLDGTHGSPERVEMGIPVLSAQNVKGGGLNFETNRYTTEREFEAFRVRLQPKCGDVLLTIVGTIGRAAVIEEERPLVFQRSVCVLRPNRKILDPRFLYHATQDRQFQSQLARAVNQSSQAGVYLGKLKELEIPLPTLSEQQRIAEILDRADTLRVKRRDALAQLEMLADAMFIDMFGDHREIFNRWPTKKLGEFLDFLTSGSRGWAKYYKESGDLFIRIQNVGRDELTLDDVAFVMPPDSAEGRRTRVRAGDVLLSITADLGRVAVVPSNLGKAFINQHLAILRTNILIPRFLSAYLASPAGRLQVIGRNRQGVKAGLNFDDIRSIVVPDVPQKLQVCFARRAAAIDKLKAAQRASLVELDALFASLQYRAFRGEL